MKRRIIAILLVLCLGMGMIPTAFAGSTLESSVNMDQLVSHGISLFKYMEAGNKWDTVANQASIGCIGMGIMGWVNSAALQLLKWCASSSKGGDPDYCRAVLGDSLYYEVVNAPVAIQSELMPKWGYWGSRWFSASEIAAAKTLLGSSVGIRVQQNLARLYLSKEAANGWDAGIRTEAALIYYCSIENHYGAGGAKKYMRYVRSALGIPETGQILSLDQFHNGVLAASNAYGSEFNFAVSYRTKVYKYLTQTLGLPSHSVVSSDPNVPFTDMPDPNHWAYDAIIWAYTHNPQITAGTSSTTFTPNGILTRAEAVTFLWAAAGKPAPQTTVNPFTDMANDAYYRKAVLWASENNITAGTSDTTFSPNQKVTLAQMITFLWVFAGRPNVNQTYPPFTDVTPDKYYYKAVLWAHYGGILVGNEGSGLNLLPNTECTRAYVVTYLYDYFVRSAP